MFGMVLQDTWLYNASIRDNIRYGKLDASEEEIQGAARAAYAHHFIETQPGGYDMEINEESNNINNEDTVTLYLCQRAVQQNADGEDDTGCEYPYTDPIVAETPVEE